MPDTRDARRPGQERLSGALALIVGPSGAGKDALINGARESLCNSGEFHFARRIVTRDVAHQSNEQHIPITDAAFEIARANGLYFLHWQAHGKKYAISSQVIDELMAGRIVVANVSRTVIAEALHWTDDATIIQVTASEALRKERLTSRGREAAADVTARLTREVSLDCNHAPLVTIDNNGSLESGIGAMVSALQTILSRRRVARGE